MRLWKVVAVLVVLSLLAVGGWLTVHLADWFSMPELDTSLLTDDPCVAPCWQNIIPGVTTEQEARSLLKGSPFVRKDSLDYAIANWKSGGEGYDWFVWNGRSKKYRNALYLREGKTVLIQLHVDYTLTAGQVANKFGPPERVYAKLTGGGVLIAYLDYPAQGLRFTADWSPRDHTELNMAVSGIALLTEDREIVEVAYFAPGPLEEVLQNPYLNAPVEVEEYLKRVQEWEGFGYIPCYQ
jgi:hypothetical protein